MKNVLLVGQCNYDGPRIKEILESNFNVSVDDIKTISEAKKMLVDSSYKLVLVNRIIDLNHEEGIQLVDHVVKEHKSIPIILLSNHDDALATAVEHGAKEGFGKKELYSHDLSRIKKILSKYI
jgi:DNA-binding NtrC family response regulator